MDLPVLNGEAKEALRRARAAAIERGLNRADLSDILGALLESEQAVRLVELFEAEPDKIQAAVAFMSEGTSWQSHPDPDAEERTVDLARAEAARLGQDETGPDHLILALVRQQNSMPGGILESMGLTLDSAREAVRYLHGLVPDWQPPTSLNSATSWAPMEMVPGSMSEEDAARMLDMSMTNFEVGMSALDRVIGIGQANEAAGVLVEMIALEIREAGGVLHWRTRTSEDRMLGDADISFSDDAGTAYQVMPSGWSGSGRESSGETLLVPKPPQEARTLTIEVRSFGRMDWMPLPPSMSRPMDVTTGPWRFEVSLSQ
jgi:hypothetical protein